MIGHTLPREPKKTLNVRFSNLFIQVIPILFFLVSIIILSTFNENFLTLRNLNNILMQASSLGLMSIGMTLVLIVGGIDLSIPPVMALGAIFGVMFMRSGGNPLLAAMIMVGIGLIGGVINGLAIAHLRMIPFVVTLSMQAIAYGACLWVTEAVGVSGVHPSFLGVVLAKIGGISVPIMFVIIITTIAQLFMKTSLYGRWLYLTGTNIRMAQVSGVPTKEIVFSAYLFSGILAGLAGIILSARLGAASASLGESGGVLDIIGSAVIGGASIYGGIGTAVGALFGAILITMISNAMNMMHVSYFNMLFIKGIIIISFVAFDSLRRRRGNRS
jgi:ribose transport system permease protein